MPREVYAASASWSGATTFPRTSARPRRSRSHNEVLLADHDGAPLFHPHGSAAEVRAGAASQQLRAVSFASALSSSAASSQAGLLLADVMPTGSHTVPPPRQVKDVNVAAPASATLSANALQVLSASALSVPAATPRATSATTPTTVKGLTSGSWPFCSVVDGCGISPKLAELLRAAATREDEDAPFMNIPAELLWLGGRRDAPSALLGRRGEPGTTTPLNGVTRASPSSRVFTSAAEALMVDPDAPRPARRRLSYKITPAPRECRSAAFASAALGPLTPLSGSTTPFISLFTKDDTATTASPLAVACMTAAPPSPGGAMLCFSTPKSPLSGAEPAVTAALLRGSSLAAPRCLRSSDAPSTLMAAIVTASSHAGPGALPPLSPFTPTDPHGGGSQHIELPLGFQGFSAHSHHVLEQRMPVNSRGCSSRAASAAATTSLLKLARQAASVASAQSVSDCTDAPYHFEDLLDDATASSLVEDDDVLRDTPCGGDFSCDVFEDGKVCEAVDDNGCDEDSSCRGLLQIRGRRVVATGAMPCAAGPASRLSPRQQLTCLQGQCDVRSCATAALNADGPATRSLTAAHAPSLGTASRVHMSLMHTTAGSDSASSYGSVGGGSTGLSTFARSTMTAPQQVLALQWGLPRPLSTQTRSGATGSGHLLDGSRSATTESSISAPDLPVFVPTSCPACLLGAAAFDSDAGGRPLHPRLGKHATPSRERELGTAADTIAKPAQRPRSSHRHAGSDGRSGCSGGGGLHRPLKHSHGAPAGTQDRIEQTHSSSVAEGRTRSAESSSDVSGWGRVSDVGEDSDGQNATSGGGENGRCRPCSAPWVRRITRPPPLHLRSLSGRPWKLARSPPEAGEEGHVADAHAGDGGETGSREIETFAALLPPTPRQTSPSLSLATPSTTVAAVAEGPQRGWPPVHARHATAVTLATSPSKATKHAQKWSAVPRGGAHGSAGVVSISPAERHTYGLPDLLACTENVTLLSALPNEIFTCWRIEDPGRPPCAAVKFADLAESLAALSCVSLSVSESCDEARCIPLRRSDKLGNLSTVAAATRHAVPITDNGRRDDREDGHKALDSKPARISVENSRIVSRANRNTAKAARTRRSTTGARLPPFAGERTLLRHTRPSATTASKLDESAHEYLPRRREESAAGAAKTGAAAPFADLKVPLGYAFGCFGYATEFFAAAYLDSEHTSERKGPNTSACVYAIEPNLRDTRSPPFPPTKTPSAMSGDGAPHIAHALPIFHSWRKVITRADGSNSRVSRWQILSDPCEHSSAMCVHPFYGCGCAEPSFLSCRLDADPLLLGYLESDVACATPQARSHVALLVGIFARSWVIHLQQPERRYRRLRKTQPTDGDGPPSSNTSGAASWLCPDSATSVPTILNVSDDAVQATLRAIDLHHRTQEPGIHISSPDTDVDAHGMAASFSCGSRGSLNTSSALPAARQYKRPLGSGRCTFAPAVFRKFLADGQRMAVDAAAWTAATVPAAVTYLVLAGLAGYLHLPSAFIEHQLEVTVEPHQHSRHRNSSVLSGRDDAAGSADERRLHMGSLLLRRCTQATGRRGGFDLVHGRRLSVEAAATGVAVTTAAGRAVGNAVHRTPLCAVADPQPPTTTTATRENTKDSPSRQVQCQPLPQTETPTAKQPNDPRQRPMSEKATRHRVATAAAAPASVTRSEMPHHAAPILMAEMLSVLSIRVHILFASSRWCGTSQRFWKMGLGSAILNAGFGSRTRLKDPAVLAARCAVETFDSIGFRVLMGSVVTMGMVQGKPSVVLYALLPGSVRIPFRVSCTAAAVTTRPPRHWTDQLVDIPPVTVFVCHTFPFAHERVLTREIRRTWKGSRELHRVTCGSAAFLETLCIGVLELRRVGRHLSWYNQSPSFQRRHPRQEPPHPGDGGVLCRLWSAEKLSGSPSSSPFREVPPVISAADGVDEGVRIFWRVPKRC
ncbi:hypothetical protein CGC21_0450 [Leishmania donovani]|uniref:Uncharacterized protein n=1 Tax=Leishmania donovani TaxID=5661 RepID=A0A504XVD5_LEIDO|nr:hypothetical protein CGC21_0450 [Leishmania donovani]